MLGDNTLRLDKILSSKYACNTGGDVCKDLKENYLVNFSKTFIQTSVARLGELMSAQEHEMRYELPSDVGAVTHIAISRDGAHMPVCPSGWREAMCGSISFYAQNGERLHTIYKGCSPEYGTQVFQDLMDSEVEAVKVLYPKCEYIGIADGAAANWKHLSKYTDIQILDFFHASEYVNKAAQILYPAAPIAQKTWAKKTCHSLKHDTNAAKKILKSLKTAKNTISIANKKDELQTIITYFTNHLDQMDYATYQEKGYPIGSGVIEAACKRLVKQRFSGSGMKWNIEIANGLLLIRGITLTEGRWEQFWDTFRNLAA